MWIHPELIMLSFFFFLIMCRSSLTQDILNGNEGCAKSAADGMYTDFPFSAM